MIEIPDFIKTENELILKVQEKLVKKKDNILKDALVTNGFDPNNKEFIKNNFESVTSESDEFIHYYFHPFQSDEKRIVSIEKKGKVDYINSIENGYVTSIMLRYF